MARQKKFNPKRHLEEVRYLASLGLNDRQIATKLNLHVDELRYVRKTCPEFEQALQQGLNETILSASTQLQRLINGGDFKAIKFFLEKKGGWGNDTVQQQAQRPNSTSFNLSMIPPKVTDES